nr:hypothetical protein [Tanacetum cinerariifolium]
MHANLKYVESLEKERDELESDKAEFSNMYDVILQECVSNDVKCSYLISLSDLDALDELQFWKEKASNVFRKEREQYFKIQDLKAQLQDKNIAISELKKLIEKGKGKSMDTKFDKPYVVRQPNAQRIPKPSVLVQTRRQLVIDPEMCMYALTMSTAELKNIKEAMADSAWIEAMQEELHQFDKLLEEVYVAQPDGFFDPEHPEKVYRIRKALYGLKQAPRAWYDELLKFLTSKGFTKGTIDPTVFTIRCGEAKYALEILHKHGMDKGQSIGTPMAMKPKLDADLSGNPVDQTDYRSKIGSLMYLTSSRRDIVQAGSSFDLTAFLDADHAGCNYTHKSTSRGIQFLGDKLVSWMSKKQNYTAMSSAEAEYVALSASCAQVMWMRTQLQDYGFNYNKIPLYCDSQSAMAISCNPVQHSRIKHIHTRRIGMRCLTPAELEVLAKESA